MSTKSYTQTIQAGGTAQFPAGSVFLILQATAALNIVATTLGNAAADTEFVGVGAGFKFKAAEGDSFSLLNVTSATAQNVTIVVGDDDVEFSNAVTVTGVALTQDQPSAALVDNPPVSCLATTQAALIAGNPSRRRVTVSSPPTNTLTVFLRKSGGANDLLPVAPGAVIEIRGTMALDYHNAGASAQTLYLFEEQ